MPPPPLGAPPLLGSAPPDPGRPPEPGAPPLEGAGALSLLEQCIRKRTEGKRLEAMARFRSERCLVVMSCCGKRLGVA
jgi:hypothetical protein